MTEIDKLLRRLARLVKKDYNKFDIKDPDSNGLVTIEVTKLKPEKIVFFYDQAKNGVVNHVKIKKNFEKQMNEEITKINLNIKGTKEIKKRLKPHYERVKDIVKEKKEDKSKKYIGWFNGRT